MKNVYCILVAFLFFTVKIYSQSPFLIEEEFDNLPTAPTGWTLTGVSNYTSGQNTGNYVCDTSHKYTKHN